MHLDKLKRLALVGGFAAAGLVASPLTASADVNKCSKEITKNAAKITTDVQKEIAKCVDGWLKEEDKVAANLAKGKVDFTGGGISSGLLKAADKCEKSMAKIGINGADITDISNEKSKLGKSFAKLVGAVNLDGVNKQKCGPKTYDQTAVDQELTQLGILDTATFGDIGLRVLTEGGLASAWDVQNVVNGDTLRVMGAAGENRCVLPGETIKGSGLACDSDADCDTGAAEVCVPTNCPDCLLFGRASNSSVGSPGLACSASAPSNAFLPCATETDCGGFVGVTDFCDDTPPQGNFVGPCASTQCISGGATATTLEGYLQGSPASGTFFCDETALDLAGTGTTGPNNLQCDIGDAPVPNVPSPLLIALHGTNAGKLCNVPGILPGGVGQVGGPARGIVASLTLAGIDVCVDQGRQTGYIDLGGGLPKVNVSACADTDVSADSSGAAGPNGCSAFTNCSAVDVPASLTLGGPEPAHTGTICQDVALAGVSAPGDAATINQQLTTVGSCLDISLSPGAPAGNLLTTGQASGDLWDAGPDIQTTGSAVGSLATSVGSRHMIAGPSNAPWSGTPYDVTALSQGRLEGGTIVGTFGSVQNDAAQAIGHSLTTIVVECVAAP